MVPLKDNQQTATKHDGEFKLDTSHTYWKNNSLKQDFLYPGTQMGKPGEWGSIFTFFKYATLQCSPLLDKNPFEYERE